MMKLTVSTTVFLALTAAYLLLSGAPLRVHFLNVLCFAIAFWAPASLASTLKELRRRWLLCALLALGGMILWDGTKHVVIMKSGSLDILRATPWGYVVGLVALGALISTSAWIGSLLSSRNPDRPKEA
jgi:hypothetical protein